MSPNPTVVFQANDVAKKKGVVINSTPHSQPVLPPSALEARPFLILNSSNTDQYFPGVMTLTPGPKSGINYWHRFKSVTPDPDTQGQLLCVLGGPEITGGTQVTALGCLSVPVTQTDYQTVVIQDVPQHDNTRGPVAYYSRPAQAPTYTV